MSRAARPCQHRAVGLLIAGLASAHAARAPRHSWATVALYNELCGVNGTLGAEFSAAQAQYLATRFDVVVLEHAQGQGAYAYNSSWTQLGPAPFVPPRGLFIEDHFASAAAQLKQADPGVTVLFYLNADAVLPFYRISQNVTSNPIPGCEDNGDHMLPMVKTWAWDHSSGPTRAMWLAGFADTLASAPALDGCYVDTGKCSGGGDAAVLETLAEMQAAAGADKIVGFHLDAPAPAGIALAQTYTFAAPGRGLEALAWLDSNAAAGKISLAHAQTSYGTAALNYSLAVFLVGAYNMSFFAFSAGPQPGRGAEEFCNPHSDGGPPVYPTWCAGQGYIADFDRALGEPLAPAAPTGGGTSEVRRAFASGTVVTVELVGSACEIAWSDGAKTSCGP